MKLFKNPNRGKTQNVEHAAYVPEYVRLDKSPTISASSREDFRRQPAPKHIAVPPQVKVSSGQNVESGWMEAQIPVTAPTNRVIIAGENQPKAEKKHTIVNTFYDEPLTSQPVKDFSNTIVQNIKEDDIQLPSELHRTEKSQQESSDEMSFSDLIPGEYVVVYDNDIIATGLLDDITDLVETILTSDEYNVDSDKLSILKKMNLRTGVLISD